VYYDVCGGRSKNFGPDLPRWLTSGKKKVTFVALRTRGRLPMGTGDTFGEVVTDCVEITVRYRRPS